MANDSNIALVALVVGLVALVVAGGQLLQQIWGTADGYRRCQRSVIGPWSRKTRLIWRWSEFRFETRFTTPEIVLYDWRAQKDVLDLNGTNIPTELRETISAKGESTTDMVSWTSLLKKLAELQGGWYQSFHEHKVAPSDPDKVVGYGTKIGVVYRERSWDLMPADTTRPMASSRLGTMIVLALRLGMRWENLNIAEGVLRAEGNGHTLISTMMRGYGVVFQYNFNSEADFLPLVETRGLIPRRSVDMLSCGILPGNSHFKVPPIPLKGKTPMETSLLLSSALGWLGVPRSTVRTITAELGRIEQDGYNSMGWPIHDMISLLTPFQPLKGSTNTQIAYPIQTNVASSIFLFRECRCLLLDRCNFDQVSTKLQFLKDKYYNDFCCEWDKAVVNDPLTSYEVKNEFIEDLRRIYHETNDYFKNMPIDYKDLVAAHVVLAAEATVEPHVNEELTEYWTRTTESYHRKLPDLIKRFSNSHSETMIEEAWWMLVLRGIVWRMSVYVSHQESVVPSRLYHDQTPVFIM